MNASVYQKLAGTIEAAFKIGKQGPTIYQGTVIPDSGLGKDGDLYIQVSVIPKLYQLIDGMWEVLSGRIDRTPVTGTSFTATNSNHYLGVNHAGAVNIFLPPGSDGKTFIIKDEGNNASGINTITIHAVTGELIETANTFVISSAGGSISLVYGTAWHII